LQQRPLAPPSQRSPVAADCERGLPTIAAAPPTTVVLVHGAFADGSSWSRVIPLLQAEGLRVIACISDQWHKRWHL
jgi:pimeloyl-ACP methyl ester carboxylesterase